jgi:hypothetical protein
MRSWSTQQYVAILEYAQSSYEQGSLVMNAPKRRIVFALFVFLPLLIRRGRRSTGGSTLDGRPQSQQIPG